MHTCEVFSLPLQRLALRRIDPADESHLARPFLDIMSDHKLDFHATFRRLAYFRPAMVEEANKDSLDQYISGILALTPEPDRLDDIRAKSDLKSWLRQFAQRIDSEREEWGKDLDAERETASRAANPRFVLRQWVLEEVIKAVEQDSNSGKKILRKVLQVGILCFLILCMLS